MFQYISSIFDGFLTKCRHKIKKSDITTALFFCMLLFIYVIFSHNVHVECDCSD